MLYIIVHLIKERKSISIFLIGNLGSLLKKIDTIKPEYIKDISKKR